MRKQPRIRALLAVMLLVAAVSLAAVLARGGSGADARRGSQRPAGEEAPLVYDRSADAEPVAAAPQVLASAERSAEAAERDDESATAADPDEATAAPRTFAMPEGASYEPEVALVRVAEGVTADEVNALLAQTDAVVTESVTQEDLAAGCLALELAEGTSVEDAVNELLAIDVIDIAQPNYYYYLQLGDEGDLRTLLREDIATPEAEQGEAAASVADAPDSADPAEALPAEGAQEPAEAAGTQADSVADPQPDQPEPTADPQPDQPEPTADPQPESADDSRPASASDPAELHLQLSDPCSQEGEDTSWNLSAINAYAAWGKVRCEGTVGVAVLDDHPSYEHEDLAGNVVDVYDASTGTRTYETSTFADHGTHVAGIVAGTADNGLGVAGVSYNASLMLVNVASATGGITSELVSKGFDHVLERADGYGIRVINLSIAGAQDASVSSDQVLVGCIDRAYVAGIVTVAASGNSPLSQKEKDASGKTVTKTYAAPYHSYPGDVERAVSVISLAVDDEDALVRSGSSNYNLPGEQCKNIAAPGSGIYSTLRGSSSYGYLSGTSMASPHVAGVLALEFAANPDLSAGDALGVLYATARDLGDEGWDEEYGYGAVDAWRAVVAASDPAKVAEIVAGDYTPEDAVAPLPTVSGATRVPVGATATYRVTCGSLALKAGTAATLSGRQLTATKAGTVTLAVLDLYGVERSTLKVTVYGLDGWWTLRPADNDALALNVHKGYVANSTNIDLALATGARQQAWRFEEQEDGAYIIRNAKSGKLVHVAWGSAKAGANVIQYPENDMLWQRWMMEVDADNYVTFIGDDAGLALGVAGSVKAGANVQQQNPTTSTRQRWQLKKTSVEVGPIWDGVYRVSSGLDQGYVLEVAGSSKANAANVRLGKARGRLGQKWLFTYLGGGLYKVRPMCSTKVLTVTRGKKAVGTNVLQGKWGKASWQKWRVVANKDGSYSIRRAKTSLVLAVQGTKAKAGANVCQARLKTTSKAQKWWLEQY